MKPSGIEWIGDIPDDWEVRKGKFLFKQRNSRGNTKKLELLSPTQKYGVIPQSKYEELTGMKPVKLDINADLASLKTICNGDYCISLRSFQGGFEYSSYEGVVSPAYQVFYPTKPISRQYYKYLFKVQSFIDKINSYAMSLRDGKNISFEDFSTTYLPFPPLKTQQKIADYLDEKCGEIDATIAKQKESIEKLKAYKQSLISETVTKGLDKSAPLKPSGIEWIGDIPAHWEVCKIKNHCNLKTGSTPSSKDLSMFDGTENWFTPSDFTENYMLKNSLRRLNAKVFDQNLVPIFPPLSVLIVGIGATTGKVGFTTSKSSSNQQITAIIPKDKNIFPKFLLFWMIANTKMIRETALFTTLPILNNDTLGNATLLIPPYKEQLELASYIENKNIEIDVIINKKQNIIQKLDTYKKSIIFECVTGKTDL